MNRRLKDVLWIGAIVVVPGLWALLLARKIAKDASERDEFRKHVRKEYGYGSKHDYDTRNV